MSKLTDRLEAYGVNIPEVMERFVDDEEMYEDCLNMFIRDASFQELGNTISAGKYEEAFDHAHALKGVAGNLGLGKMFQALCDIVEPLRKKDYSNLDRQYTAVLKALDEVTKI